MSDVDPFEFWIQKHDLIRHCIRKVMRRYDFEQHVSFDDLEGVALDKLPRIIQRDDGKQSLLTSWVYTSLYWELVRFYQNRNKLVRRYGSVEKLNKEMSEKLIENRGPVGAVYSDRQAIEILKANLSDKEFDLLSLHHAEGLTFEEMAAIRPASRATIQRHYLAALYKARKLMKDCFK